MAASRRNAPSLAPSVPSGNNTIPGDMSKVVRNRLGKEREGERARERPREERRSSATASKTTMKTCLGQKEESAAGEH